MSKKKEYDYSIGIHLIHHKIYTSEQKKRNKSIHRIHNYEKKEHLIYICYNKILNFPLVKKTYLILMGC